MLHERSSPYFDARPNTISIAGTPLEFDGQPVAAGSGVVDPDLRRCRKRADHDVQPAITVEIADTRAPVPGRPLRQSGFGRQCLELQTAGVAEHCVWLVD